MSGEHRKYKSHFPFVPCHSKRKTTVQSGFQLAVNAQAKLHGLFSDLYALRDENFGNAREARNIFERAITKQSNRIVEFSVIDERMLTIINAEDIPSEPIQKL